MARRVLLEEDTDLRLLSRAIWNGRLTVIHGGRLTREYERVSVVLDVVVELDRTGLAKRVGDSKIDNEIATMQSVCCSDDEHIIALARASGARLLCTEDQDLQTDFGTKELVDNPRGKIFKNSTHRRLLQNACEAC